MQEILVKQCLCVTETVKKNLHADAAADFVLKQFFLSKIFQCILNLEVLQNFLKTENLVKI